MRRCSAGFGVVEIIIALYSAGFGAVELVCAAVLQVFDAVELIAACIPPIDSKPLCKFLFVRISTPYLRLCLSFLPFIAALAEYHLALLCMALINAGLLVFPYFLEPIYF